MFLFFNIGIILLGFGIEPPRDFWIFSFIFGVSMLLYDIFRYKSGDDVNIFRGSILTLIIALTISYTFPLFNLLASFWLYFLILCVFQILVGLEKKIVFK